MSAASSSLRASSRNRIVIVEVVGRPVEGIDRASDR